MKNKSRPALAFCAAATLTFAVAVCPAIELTEPAKGATVSLVPDAQKRVMSLPTLEERIQLLADDKALYKSKTWRKPCPLVLKWKCAENERGPWKIEIGRCPDLSDARVWEVDAKKNPNKTLVHVPEMEFTVPLANLEVARKYYWRVSCRNRCRKYNCNFKCKCPESKEVAASEISFFCTEDFAPRWIEIEGRASNIRDLGGRLTSSGRRVRQGMAIRGQGLNDNSKTGERKGRNRLTVEDVKYLAGTLGIRTDLDLRGSAETADMTESPLGPDVAFVQFAAEGYKKIFEDFGKSIMARTFRVFCDRKNYPIYFHCIGGADRTGALAYVLNGVLGVDRHDLETDFESTFYPNIPDVNPDPNYWRRESHFNDGFSKYGDEGDSWNRRIELYLLDCGVTEEEIAAFRSIMLEE